MAFPLNSRHNQTANNCKKKKTTYSTQTCEPILFIHTFMPKWPLRRIRPRHKKRPKNSQNNNTKHRTPDYYSTRL